MRSKVDGRAAGLCIFLLAALAGCGKNKFEQELEREKGAAGLARETRRGGYDIITTEELKALIDKKQDMILIDAMPFEESYKPAHIPGAKQFLFPIAEMVDTWDGEATGKKTTENYQALLGPDKTKLIVVYCGFVACKRSHNGAAWAMKLGYTNVKRHPGGIHAWKGASYSTESVP